MIIAIDGPAGSGKSTIAQGVARRLGLAYLDTGAMYRAVTLIALERSVSLEDGDALGALALEMRASLRGRSPGTPRVYVGERDVSEAIRRPEVSRAVSQVAAHPNVRNALTVRQRELAADGDIVLEGRDTGTVVCPDADIKVFLTASVEERARRRRSAASGTGCRRRVERSSSGNFCCATPTIRAGPRRRYREQATLWRSTRPSCRRTPSSI